ncbi:hypothetical protein SABIM44S_00309 [Streptomyces abikoensis]
MQITGGEARTPRELPAESGSGERGFPEERQRKRVPGTMIKG